MFVSVYVCVCVFVCFCVYECVNTCVYMCVCVCVCSLNIAEYISLNWAENVCACLCVCICVSVCVCVFIIACQWINLPILCFVQTSDEDQEIGESHRLTDRQTKTGKSHNKVGVILRLQLFS